MVSAAAPSMRSMSAMTKPLPTAIMKLGHQLRREQSATEKLPPILAMRSVIRPDSELIYSTSIAMPVSL
ncbi:hypothetical protein D3C86_2206050 [compost metagenome]